MSEEINVYINEKHIGFRTQTGKLYLQRCPECEKENYALCVATGMCAWCGWREKDERTND